MQSVQVDTFNKLNSFSTMGRTKLLSRYCTHKSSAINNSSQDESSPVYLVGRADTEELRLRLKPGLRSERCLPANHHPVRPIVRNRPFKISEFAHEGV